MPSVSTNQATNSLQKIIDERKKPGEKFIFIDRLPFTARHPGADIYQATKDVMLGQDFLCYIMDKDGVPSIVVEFK